ncbi:unnamed protein product [Echinostoma caproni]|uniref:protein-serine/threonine phosphatase n=1 Tax=Echinostoma caproni TaxID=27848 RepID=A0A183B173_9TREM|nr:unnamed protein product [Echinostoma caproni]
MGCSKSSGLMLSSYTSLTTAVGTASLAKRSHWITSKYHSVLEVKIKASLDTDEVGLFAQFAEFALRATFIGGIIQNLHRYRLPGSPLVYHTSFRPHLLAVLDCLSKYYEMHICTFGNRVYAHRLASFIDPKRRYFSHRILSRDECFNPVTKSANLKFFPDTGDINALAWSNSNDNQRSANKPPVTTIPTTPESSVLEGDSPPKQPLPSSASEMQIECTPTTDSSLIECVEKLVDEKNDYPGEPTEPSLMVEDSPFRNNVTDSTTVTEQTDLVTDTKVVSSESLAHSDEVAPAANVRNDQIDSDEKSDSDTYAIEPEQPIVSVSSTPEEMLEAADGNYLLRLQEILIGVHRSFFRAYDKWRARQSSSHQSHTYTDR